MQANLSTGIFQVAADEHVADDASAFEGVFGLRNQFLPVFLLRLPEVDGDDAGPVSLGKFHGRYAVPAFDAGVVEGTVQATETPDRRLNQGLDLFSMRDVGPEEMRLPAKTSDRFEVIVVTDAADIVLP